MWRISGEWKITLRHVKAGLLVLVSFRIMVKFKHQITEQERLQTHRVSTKVVKTLVDFCSLYFLGKGSRDELQSNSPVTFYRFLAMTVLKFYTPLITTPCHLQHETNYSRINWSDEKLMEGQAKLWQILTRWIFGRNRCIYIWWWLAYGPKSVQLVRQQLKFKSKVSLKTWTPKGPSLENPQITVVFRLQILDWKQIEWGIINPST